MVLMMSFPDWMDRPECSEVLTEYNKWAIDQNILVNDTQFEPLFNRLKCYEILFFYEFMQNKSKNV